MSQPHLNVYNRLQGLHKVVRSVRQYLSADPEKNINSRMRSYEV